jgi:hypothetical protein
LLVNSLSPSRPSQPAQWLRRKAWPKSEVGSSGPWSLSQSTAWWRPVSVASCNFGISECDRKEHLNNNFSYLKNQHLFSLYRKFKLRK